MDGSGRFTGAPRLAATLLGEPDLGGGPNGGWAERRAAVCGGGVAVSGSFCSLLVSPGSSARQFNARGLLPKLNPPCPTHHLASKDERPAVPLTSHAVSGPGAYGGLQAPAEDDTGVRPSSGTSGQQADAVPATRAAAEGQQQPGKAAYLQQQYGGASDTGLDGTETTAAAGGNAGAPRQGAGGKQQAGQLTVIDDDA